MTGGAGAKAGGAPVTTAPILEPGGEPQVVRPGVVTGVTKVRDGKSASHVVVHGWYLPKSLKSLLV